MELVIKLLTDLLLYMWSITKVIIPLMIVMEIFKDLKLVDKISKLMKPMTNFFTISEESSISLIFGMVFGLMYGAGAIIQSTKDYNVDKRSVFLICIFLSLCHAVIEDTLLFAAIGASLSIVLLSRVIAAVLTTFVLSKLVKKDVKDSLDLNEMELECAAHKHH